MTAIAQDADIWQERADHLQTLLIDVAQYRSNAAVTYANAFLAAGGTDRQREQTAKLAAGADQLLAEEAAAALAAFRVMLDVWRMALAAHTHPPGTQHRDGIHGCPACAAEMGSDD
jgi:hypothetical protein